MAKRPVPTAQEHINYSFIPNHRVTMEALVRSRLSAREFRCVILILNQTDGYLRPEDTIKPAFFSERTGIPKSHLPHVLKRLQKWNVVHRETRVFKVNPPDEWHPDAKSPSKLAKNGEKQNGETTRQKRRNDSPKTAKRLAKNGEKQKGTKENTLKKTTKEVPNPALTPLASLVSFSQWLDYLEIAPSKVGALVDAFKALHASAPAEDLGPQLGGRIAVLYRVCSKDYRWLLQAVWLAAAMPIVGSHLSYIQGMVRKESHGQGPGLRAPGRDPEQAGPTFRSVTEEDVESGRARFDEQLHRVVWKDEERAPS